MKLILRTDFFDYYDHNFDIASSDKKDIVVFERYSENGISRQDMFSILSDKGIPVPIHGTPRQIYKELSQALDHVPISYDIIRDYYLVVYTDQFKHRGEGKRLIRLETAMRFYPSHFCSVFIPSGQFWEKSLSYRYLYIGGRSWWMKFESKHNWKSNTDPLITILCEQACDHLKLDYPLYALDFVIDTSGKMYAIDLNTSPGLKGTGIEDVLPAREVVNLIRAWYEYKRG